MEEKVVRPEAPGLFTLWQLASQSERWENTGNSPENATMRWTWEDKEKLDGQVVEILDATETEGAVKRVMDLVSDTFLISGCPVENAVILYQLDTFLTLSKMAEIKKELAQTGQSQVEFVARALAEWVGETINRTSQWNNLGKENRNGV
jgi:coenzyme F420-reducing hydrogenase gamma subunit